MAIRLNFPGIKTYHIDKTTTDLLLTLSRLDKRFEEAYKKSFSSLGIFRPGVYSSVIIKLEE